MHTYGERTMSTHSPCALLLSPHRNSTHHSPRYRIAHLDALPALLSLYDEGPDYLLRNHCQVRGCACVCGCGASSGAAAGVRYCAAQAGSFAGCALCSSNSYEGCS